MLVFVVVVVDGGVFDAVSVVAVAIAVSFAVVLAVIVAAVDAVVLSPSERS